MSRLIELVPVALAGAIYIWGLWVLLIQTGFNHLTWIGQGLAVSMLPAIVGALWFMVKELEGIQRIMGILLMLLPVLYYSALVVAALLHII